jgi:S-adenosylmethionine-diacylglycerol 3-amino-3-carboxypropyl transferase
MNPLCSYGLSQEDALTELEALDLRPDDRLLCVASGGEIPLNLLALRRIRIDAVDISPGQLALSRLKLAACRALEPEEAAIFLGFTEATAVARDRVWGRVAAFLEEDDLRFWEERKSFIEEGAIQAGRFERYLEKFRRAGRLILGERKLRRLFELETKAERGEYFDRFLSTPLLKLLFRAAFDPRVYRKRGIATEGLTHGCERRAADFFYGRFRDFCTATPPRKNYYLQWSLFGRVLYPEARPEYLTEEGVERIRERATDIHWRLASVEGTLEGCAYGAFNKFHLSNIGDWMSRTEFAGLLTRMCAKAAAGSRAAVRYIHLDHPVPEALLGRLARNESRGEELMRRDRFPFYNLVVMEIR